MPRSTMALSLFGGPYAPSVDEQPWNRYSKDPLPHGLAYPVGRDIVQRELQLAGASVSSLSFSRPDRHSVGTVLDIHCSGDVPRRRDDAIPDEGFVLMVLQAVPSTDRAAIAAQLRDRWLPEAAAWVARIPEQGDAWRASDHRWLLRHGPDGLALTLDLLS